MSVPITSSTGGYLMKAVPKIRPIITDIDLTREQKLKGISSLISSKHIGRRGHLWFDVGSMTWIIIMAAISALVLRNQLHQLLACFVGITIALILTLFEFFYYQREPSAKLVAETIVKLKKAASRL